MTKICFLTPGILPVPDQLGGAVENLTTALINYLSSLNDFQVDVVTCPLKEQTAFPYKVIEIKDSAFWKLRAKVLKKLNRRKIPYTAYDLKAAKVVGSGDYDFVIVENSMTAAVAYIKYKSNKTKLIFHLHNDFDGYSKTPFLYSRITEEFDTIITVSNYIKSRLLEVDKKQVCVLPNGIDDALFSGRFEVDHKHNMDINEKECVFAFFGRIEERKGVFELIQAFREVKETNFRMRLVIAGSTDNSSPDSMFYFEKVKELSSGDNRISFLGHVNHEQVPSFLSNVDVVVIPSLWEEPFGMVATESMALGKCIIYSDSGELPFIVADEECMVHRSNIVAELATKIRYFATNPDARLIKSIENKDRFDKTDCWHSRSFVEGFLDIINC